MKLRKIIVLLSILALLSGCTGKSAPSDGTDTSAPTETLTLPTVTAPATEPTTVPPDPEPEPFTLDLSKLINIDWPDYGPYKPDKMVYPLTNEGIYYYYGVFGKVTFVDENLDIIPLPFETQRYAPVVGHYLDEPWVKAYGLDDGKLMFADGTFPRDADGEYYTLIDDGHNSTVYVNMGGAVVIRAKPGTVDGGFGLYNLRERRQVLECVYGYIYPIDYGIFTTSKGNTWYLFDEMGKELYSHIFEEDSAWLKNNPGVSIFGVEYYLDAKNKLFYKYSDFGFNGYNNLQKWGGYYFITNVKDETWQSVTIIASLDGDFVYRSYNRCYRDAHDNLIFIGDDRITIIDNDLNETHFLFKSTDYEKIYSANYDGREVTICYAKPNNNGNTEYIAVDKTGNIRQSERYNPQKDKIPEIDLKDANGIVVKTVPINSYRVRRVGDFVIEAVLVDEVIWSAPKAIYSLNGYILMDDIYGYVNEAVLPDGGMFVYTSSDKCVILYPDGRTVPFPNAPFVKKFRD